MEKQLTVTKKTASKIGLFGAICIIISAVVGIGAFFKNGSVFKNNGGNSIGVLLSWVLAAAIALFTACSFAEVVTCKGVKNANTGLAGWSGQLCGYNFGRAVKVWQPCFYYIIKVFAMGMFASAALFQIFFSTHYGGTWFGHNTIIAVMFVGLGLVALFIFLNYISKRFGQGFSKFTTIVKFIPFWAILVIGLIYGIIVSHGGLWSGDWYTWDNSDVPVASAATSANGIFKSIPAILFAFDSFLVIGNVAGRVDNKEKNVPLAVVISMSIAVALEVLMAISLITIGAGDPYLVFYVAFGNGIAYKIAVVILSVFIMIAALGVLNSLVITGVGSMQSSIDEEILFGSRWIKKYRTNDPVFHGTMYFSGFILFFFLAIAIPSMILNTDQIFDGISNLAILFFFAIYGTVVLFTFINRFTKKVGVNKFKGFYFTAIISIIGCYFAFGYCAFYQFIANIIKDPTGTSSNAWGLSFLGKARSTNLNNWQCATVFWTAAMCFIAWPFINDGLIKATNKKYGQALIWEKSNVRQTIESKKR